MSHQTMTMDKPIYSNMKTQFDIEEAIFERQLQIIEARKKIEKPKIINSHMDIPSIHEFMEHALIRESIRRMQAEIKVLEWVISKER